MSATNRYRWLALALPLLAANAARAAEAPIWDVAIGGGPLMTWAYPGASTLVVRPVPYVDVTYKDTVQFNSLDGLRVTAWQSGGFSAGLAGQYRWGRSRRDMPNDQRGLGNIRDTVELGGFVGYETGPLSAEALLTRDILGVHDGLVLQTRASVGIPIGDPALKQGIEIGPFLEFTDRSFARRYFGVDPTQSAASGFPTYSPGGGLDQYGVQLNGSMNLATHWSMRGFATYGRLRGDAAASTVVRDGGSRDQVAGGVFLVWSPGP